MQESRERCDAAFSENREPGDFCVCRKDFLGKVPEKIFGEIVLGKIWWSGLSLELKFSRMEFRGGGMDAER